MSLLLDTQALLWFLLDNARLINKARTAIVELETQIITSLASLWEIANQVSLGKYELPEPFDLFWDNQLKANHMTLLPISVAHTSCVTELPFHHRDPFDRLIIAQAIVEGISMISSDRMFDQYDVARVW